MLNGSRLREDPNLEWSKFSMEITENKSVSFVYMPSRLFVASYPCNSFPWGTCPMLCDHAFRKSSFPWILRLHGASCKRFHWQAMIWFTGSGILVIMCSEGASPAQASAVFFEDTLKGFTQQFITEDISKIPRSGIISLSGTLL
ncbi:hypothetical protein M514_09960 [Trichuris suis]|uniref:Uncharacterized protein n=1 Tax=Trichuris suis TaxID=68888 RepID=A0A085LVZ0_9BILA|nr:hypothetical protein M513_09960 [Trichuris suis]KFD62193.1 hypothetical protein M514_09960 [Trichuris suis]